ncbi:hypothetical protein M422DRAFT_244013 [Sphaerobolus stellatus SS14]|nr:hypothetical protein M422DRAFT_244013 [Sphaerobolus stellatus SS14]
MSTHCSRKQVEEPSMQAVGEDEPLQGLTLGEVMDPPSTSVDPQQSSKVFAQEQLGDQNTRVQGPQTVPIRVQSPIGAAGAAGTSAPSQCLLQGIISGSDSGHNFGGAPDESDCASPDEGGRLRKEYEDLMNLKENGEIALMEAMEATE